MNPSRTWALMVRAGAVMTGTAALCLIGACTSGAKAPQFFASDISGVMPDLSFALTQSGHRELQASDLHGEVVLMYFGYAHCPDACPMTMTHVAQAVHGLGTAAQHVRVLFISVDPKRDSPESLASYVAPMGARFIGLTGTDAQLNELVRRYRVVSGRGPSDAHGNYVVYHSTGVFVFDRAGRARLLVMPSETVPQLTADVSRLIG